MAIDTSLWNKLSPLLDAALDMPPENRRAWLEELRQSDAHLAAQLQDLIHHADAATDERFLDEPTHPLLPPSPAGKRIGAYTLTTLLGEGGMGVVWLAERSDGRFVGNVAIKLLHSGLVRPAVAERFRREGAILARLAHPHIARLHDAGVADDGQPYLVLEHVAGLPIDRWCDERRLPLRQRIVLFLQVLDAVAHAHTRLVIHRDIKPSNVLVDIQGSAKLLDFGIAKLLDDDDGGEPTQLTRESGPGLTPLYAAPEQQQGGAITTGTDIYALGLLLYVLLTGQHPRQGPDSRARPLLDYPPASRIVVAGEPSAEQRLANAHARSTVPARLAGMLAGDIDNILAKALKSETGERYGTVAAFAEDLQRHLDGKTVHARPDTLSYRLGRFIARHRIPVAAASIALVAILAGAAGTWTQARRAEAQAAIAHIERDRAERRLVQAEAVEEFLLLLLSSQDDKPFTTAELLRRGEAMVREQFSGTADLRAWLLGVLAALTGELNEEERATTLLTEARAAAAEAGDGELLAALDCGIASSLVAVPDAQAAAQMFEAAIAWIKERPEVDRAALAACLNHRALRASLTGNPALAAQDYQAALDQLGTPRPAQRTLALAIRMGLAGTDAQLGRLAPAVAGLRQALSELEAMGHGRTLGANTFRNNLGVLLYRSGDLPGALAQYQAALGSTGGSTGESTAPLLKNVAVVLLELGRTDEALAAFTRSQAIARTRGDSPTAAQGVAAFAHCSEPLPMCERRLNNTRTALAGFLPPDHPSFAELDLSLARIAIDRNAPALAERALTRAAQLPRDSKVPSLVRGRLAVAASRLAAARRQWPAARTHADAAVGELRQLADGLPYSYWLGQALLAQAVALRHAGDAEAARQALTEAASHIAQGGGERSAGAREVRRLAAEFAPPG